MKNMLLYPSNNDFMLKYSRQVIILKHNFENRQSSFYNFKLYPLFYGLFL